jgi:hypothetical protein
MSLHITATLTEDDLVLLLRDLLPATIDLDPLGAEAGRRWIRFDEPHHVDFVPKVGLRVRTSAALQWTAVGIAVPATIREVELLLQPLVTADEQGPKLVFRPMIEKADFKMMPEFVDQAITGRINAMLAAEGDLTGWHFGEGLARRVPLPKNLSPVDAFHLGAGPMEIEVQDRAFVLRLEVNMSFSRNRKDAAALPTA